MREAGAREALVIGNEAYESSSIWPLNNPVRDAEAVSEALRQSEFAVALKRNLKEGPFHEALDAFEEDSRRAATAVFYYAGHGMEQAGANYLIPVDVGRPTGAHEAIELEKVIESMQGEWNLVFPDAGRIQSGRTIAHSPLSRGLAVVALEPADDIRISSAAEPGTAVEHGEAGGNPPYAAALAAHIGTPGQRLADLLMEVEVAASTATEGRQRTWSYGSPGPPLFSCRHRWDMNIRVQHVRTTRGERISRWCEGRYRRLWWNGISASMRRCRQRS